MNCASLSIHAPKPVQSKKTIPDTLKNIPSIGSEDGWVLESTQTSNKGGFKNNIASTFRLGDDISKRQYRSILSFDTSSLPLNTVITKITLKMKKQSVTGRGDPFILFHGLIVEIKKGTFDLPSLQPKDFQLMSTNTYGPFSPVPKDRWYSIDLSDAAPYFNWAGKTQIRLKFVVGNDTNSKANFISLYSGNSSAINRPVLVIEYYVP